MNDTQELNEFLNHLHESDGFYMKTGLEETKRWFEVAIPDPTWGDACVQIGCHLEEVAEMMEALGLNYIAMSYHSLADAFKSKNDDIMDCVIKADKKALLDSLSDQTVTACGVSHMFRFDHIGALNEVNRSNFSKFENGKAVFNEQGKITKGKHYSPPDLKPFI